MEWPIRQQMQCLLQSVMLGMLQGLLLDLLTGMVRILPRKRWLWTDIVFGPIAAIITFCGALIILDGQLHPLLFFGVFLGMVTEHVAIGVWVCGVVRRARKQIHRWWDGLLVMWGLWRRKMWSLVGCKRKCAQNDEKE